LCRNGFGVVRGDSLIDRRFDKAGADSILVVTPFYAAPPQRGAVSYFGKLGARTRKPFLIYHIPGRAGFALTVDTLEAIKDQVPHFAGLKNTDTDFGFVTGALARLGRGFRIFAGLELPTLPMLGIGGCGMMITASNVAPHLVAQLYETFVKREIDGAIALNLRLYPLFRGVGLESSPIPVSTCSSDWASSRRMNIAVHWFRLLLTSRNNSTKFWPTSVWSDGLRARARPSPKGDDTFDSPVALGQPTRRSYLNGSAFSPKLLCRKIRALAHRFELLPHDCGMNFSLVKRLRGEPAVRASHDILAPD